MQLTPQQALDNLVIAARSAQLTAEQHEAIRVSGLILHSIINPKPAPTPGEADAIASASPGAAKVATKAGKKAKAPAR